MFSAAFDVLIKILKVYHHQNPTLLSPPSFSLMQRKSFLSCVKSSIKSSISCNSLYLYLSLCSPNSCSHLLYHSHECACRGKRREEDSFVLPYLLLSFLSPFFLSPCLYLLAFTLLPSPHANTLIASCHCQMREEREIFLVIYARILIRVD